MVMIRQSLRNLKDRMEEVRTNVDMRDDVAIDELADCVYQMIEYMIENADARAQFEIAECRERALRMALGEQRDNIFHPDDVVARAKRYFDYMQKGE